MIYVLAVFFPWLALMFSGQWGKGTFALALDIVALALFFPLHVVIVIVAIIHINQKRGRQKEQRFWSEFDKRVKDKS